MKFKFSGSHQNRIQQEMLQAILADKVTSPWSSTEDNATTLINNLEATSAAFEVSHVEASQWNRLAQQAEQLWAKQSAHSLKRLTWDA